jgi:hypothetical protein
MKFCVFRAEGFLMEAACIAVMLAISAAISLRGKHGDTPEWRKVGRATGSAPAEAASPHRLRLGEALLEDGQRERHGTAPSRL